MFRRYTVIKLLQKNHHISRTTNEFVLYSSILKHCQGTLSTALMCKRPRSRKDGASVRNKKPFKSLWVTVGLGSK